MPVLETTDKIVPRSVLRHRPITPNASQPTGATTMTPLVQRASRGQPQPADASAEVTEWQRIDGDTPPTAQRVTGAAASRKATTGPKPLPKASRSTTKTTQTHSLSVLRAHPLLYLGVGMLAMLALWTMLSVAVSWGQTTLNDLRYGRPRTYQVDRFVGHNEAAGIPSHFMAINLNRRIEIIEFPGGDATKARVYLGPQLFGPGDELAPVTLSFADVNGDRKPDMIIRFQDSEIVFLNDQGSFRPLRPDERPQVERYLQRYQP
ncbi:MAG: hypothetical protein M3Y81_09320 [Chloroflexota bacterium]|nr:hypothetical protein [Chloroflexota bacterium]